MRSRSVEVEEFFTDLIEKNPRKNISGALRFSVSLCQARLPQILLTKCQTFKGRSSIQLKM